MPVRKKPPNAKNPKGSIFLLFHQVQQKMDIEQKNLFLKYDITPRQFIVLQTIDFQPGSNQNEIISLLGSPTRQRLDKRNRKFFFYQLNCENTIELSIRFNAIGAAKEIMIVN